MKHNVRLLVAIGLISIGSLGLLIKAMEKAGGSSFLDTAGEAIGGAASINVDTKIAICTAIGGGAEIQAGAIQNTSNWESEASTSQQTITMKAEGGNASCGDVITGNKTTTSSEFIPQTTTEATYYQPDSTSAVFGSIGDIGLIGKAEYASLQQNALDLVPDQVIETTFPAVGQMKMFKIVANNREFILKTISKSPLKQKIIFYVVKSLQNPRIQKAGVSLLEIGNMTISTNKSNVASMNILLKAGYDGTTVIKLDNYEQMLPTSVPDENFANYSETPSTTPSLPNVRQREMPQEVMITESIEPMDQNIRTMGPESMPEEYMMTESVEAMD